MYPYNIKNKTITLGGYTAWYTDLRQHLPGHPELHAVVCAGPPHHQVPRLHRDAHRQRRPRPPPRPLRVRAPLRPPFAPLVAPPGGV
eukprot:921839-Prorocentrum_minimum.AAC.2